MTIPTVLPDLVSTTTSCSFETPTEVLKNLLTRAQTIVPTKEIIPGTAQAQIEVIPTSPNTGMEHINFHVTDGDRALTTTAPAHCFVSGTMRVPVRRLLDAIKTSSALKTRLEAIGPNVIVLADRSQWVFQVNLDAKELKHLGTPEEYISVDKTVFLHAIKVALSACPASTSRLSLRQIAAKDGYVFGCDGARIHRARLPEELDHWFSIPTASAQDLVRALEASPSDTFQIGSNELYVVSKITTSSGSEDVLLTRRLSLPLPDLAQPILHATVSNQHRLLVDRLALARALRSVRVNADRETDQVSLALEAKTQDANGDTLWQMIVHAEDHAGNSSREVLDCQWNGKTKPAPLHLRASHLLDVVDLHTGELLRLLLGDSSVSAPSPVLIEDDESLFLVQQTLA